MQVKTERRLGFIAALGLTIAVFIAPTISTQTTHDLTRSTSHLVAMLAQNTTAQHYP